MLSLVSRGVGVAVVSEGPKNALEHVHFQRLADQRILAVVVTRSGVVRDRVLRVGRALAQPDLDLASRYINENFRGWTLDTVRAELERRIEQERSEYDRLMASIEQLYRNGALARSRRNCRVRRRHGQLNFKREGFGAACGNCCRRWRRSSASASCSRLIWTRGRKRCAW